MVKSTGKYTGQYPNPKKYLEKGDKGTEVTKLQNYLNWYTDGKFFKKCGKADGIYGKNTLKYVKAMQTDFFGKKQADGKVGQKTITKMKEVGGYVPTPQPSGKFKVMDISAWQGKISVANYKKAMNYGIKAVILRIGYTGSSSKAPTIDKVFENNYANAISAGLPVGIYYYSLATTKAAAEKEANWVVSKLKGKKITYPVYIDVEDNATQGKVSKSALAMVCNTFCNIINKAGYTAGVYASVSWFNSKIGNITAPHTKWVAQYYKKCEYSGTYDMWQYTSAENVSGIAAKTDVSWCYKDFKKISEAVPTVETTVQPIIETTVTTEPKTEVVVEPIVQPAKQTYNGSYPTATEIKTASNAGIRKSMCAWAKQIADSKEYKYKNWESDDSKTHQCPICHNLTGKYKGWNCIGFAFACWRHGGNLKTKCNCSVISNEVWNAILTASDADALKKAKDRLGIDDVIVIRNNGKSIAASKLQKGDICTYFNGKTYFHTVLYVGNSKIADSSSGNTNKYVTYGKAYKPSVCKVAIRFTGGRTYLSKGDEGAAVTKLQNYLNWYTDGKFFKECGKADGIFGDNTLKWTKAFQESEIGIGQGDGLVGEKTIAKMREIANAIVFTPIAEPTLIVEPEPITEPEPIIEEPTPEPVVEPEPIPEVTTVVQTKAPYTGEYPNPTKYLEKEDKGTEVVKLQNYLNWYTDGKFFQECGSADGIYGENTYKYVLAMQADFFGPAEADGLVGQKTITEMKKFGSGSAGNGKSLYEVAIEVIYGVYGSGDERKANLIKAGYDYYAVQAEVTRLVATRDGKITGMLSWAKQIADSGKYKYKKWKSGDTKTHQCPICHNLTGSYKGWNCIGYAWASWKHGAGLPINCSCSTIDDGGYNKILKASDEEALKKARKSVGINDIKVIRNGGKTIPASMLQPGDVVAYYKGNSYFHTVLYIGNGKIAESNTTTPNITYNKKKYNDSYGKVAFRYVGN